MPMPLSDRQHDAFDNPAKALCRNGNLRVLREAAHLLCEDDSRSRLRCDWCELMGATGLLTLDMLEREGVLAAGGFVGVDLDAARIDGFRRSRPDLKWIAGNLYEHLHAPEMANVGVLNLDEYGEIGNRSAETDFPLIHGLVRPGTLRRIRVVLESRPRFGVAPRPKARRGAAPPRRYGRERPAKLPAAPRADLGHAATAGKRSGHRRR
jgi:hypothetical protein